MSFKPSRTSTIQVIVVLEPVTDSAESNSKAIFSG
jgi:hypothetical protein